MVSSPPQCRPVFQRDLGDDAVNVSPAVAWKCDSQRRAISEELGGRTNVGLTCGYDKLHLERLGDGLYASEGQDCQLSRVVVETELETLGCLQLHCLASLSAPFRWSRLPIQHRPGANMNARVFLP
jgi:hypothetical protein